MMHITDTLIPTIKPSLMTIVKLFMTNFLKNISNHFFEKCWYWLCLLATCICVFPRLSVADVSVSFVSFVSRLYMYSDVRRSQETTTQ